jgi:hypothetical protein
MKKNTKIAIGVGVVLILALSSCGSSNNTSEPAPAVTVTKTVTEPAPVVEPAPATDLPSGGVVDAIRGYDSWYNDIDSATITDTAQSICGALQGGASVEDVLVVAETTIGLDHAPALIAGAIAYLCPDQSYKVN